jgi:hypothetical protein
MGASCWGFTTATHQKLAPMGRSYMNQASRDSSTAMRMATPLLTWRSTSD